MGVRSGKFPKCIKSRHNATLTNRTVILYSKTLLPELLSVVRTTFSPTAVAALHSCRIGASSVHWSVAPSYASTEAVTTARSCAVHPPHATSSPPSALSVCPARPDTRQTPSIRVQTDRHRHSTIMQHCFTRSSKKQLKQH